MISDFRIVKTSHEFFAEGSCYNPASSHSAMVILGAHLKVSRLHQLDGLVQPLQSRGSFMQ